MNESYFQEEETYLFYSLLGRLQVLLQEESSLATKCFLAIFWRIYGEKEFLEPLINELEKEIEGYNSDPTRESNRTIKVFICATYKAIMQNYSEVKYNEKIYNYLSYTRDSKDWLGQPRIACCISFLKKDALGEEAKKYLCENFSRWLSEEKDEFITVALLALRGEISSGNLQSILEHVMSKINGLSLTLISLYLIGISQSNLDLSMKATVEDKLYQAIRNKLKGFSASASSIESEGIISASAALFVAKYHKISGYFEKYSSELKDTLALKNYFTEETKKAKTRNILLCITSIVTVGLVCLIFFIPSLVEFNDNPSAFGRLLLAINTKKLVAASISILLSGYILISYFIKGDPVFGIMEFLGERFPIIKNIKGREEQNGRFHSNK
jgi:hypothetical protein